MRQLAFDHIGGIALFIKDRAGHTAEAMACHAPFIPHTAQRHQKHPIADMLLLAGGTVEDKFLVPGQFLQVFQYAQRLP